LRLADFDYPLPPELIAQQPTAERARSRLLVVQGATLADHRFDELPALLAAGDLLVMNDTRVLHARLYGRKESGGRVEVLIERIVDERSALAQLRASKSPRPGTRLWLEDAFAVEVGERQGEFWSLYFPDDALTLVERHGRLPLPPYIDRDAVKYDETRYQTVYARHYGSVAAPTAGLHFDEALLGRLRAAGIELAFVTLHVGAGTFQPVRVDDIRAHRMHSERWALPQQTVDAIAATRARGGRVIAVGTTTLRTLESSALLHDGELRAGSGETDLFITPGFRFRVADLLITNFHLPKSTLLMLTAAFAGLTFIQAAYAHAVAQRYRFFSYGDATLLYRHDL